MVNAGMPPRTALAQVHTLLENAGCPDAGYDAAFLYMLATGRNARLTDIPLTQPQAEKLENLSRRRAARVPLQYLAGTWGFLDFSLHVGPGVLCPRADTEIVAEAAVEAVKATGKQKPQVLDLCAGAGALGLGIKRFVPGATVTCVEKSAAALAYLRQNAAALVPLGIPTPAITPVIGDLFTYSAKLPAGSLDLIVCNPPYLTQAEMGALQPEVAKEPAMALDGGADGLVFYRALAEHYQKALVPGGCLVLEIGWQQRESVTALLEKNGWQDVCCRQDFGGNDRCLTAKRPKIK
ncbi:MAG: peptide chain release factor N(5)-glutamine methyltransferase [Faecalibacterium sp.]|jgi:release factor glutamine methyltransferase|nr:peptide chain release factor N(5)-glutamine methyltransferase [Faecalibacterium sp.]